MRTMSYSESRARYAEILQTVTDNREEVVIIRKGRRPAVIVDLEDYNSLRETAYLLRSPRNAQHLLDSVDQLPKDPSEEHQREGIGKPEPL